MKRDNREKLEEVVKELRRAVEPAVADALRRCKHDPAGAEAILRGEECTRDLYKTIRAAARELERVLETETEDPVTVLHGRVVEPAVVDAIRRYKRDPAEAEAILRGDEPYRLHYDMLCNCYLFEDHGMTVGVELDGYLHT